MNQSMKTQIPVDVTLLSGTSDTDELTAELFITGVVTGIASVGAPVATGMLQRAPPAVCSVVSIGSVSSSSLCKNGNEFI